MPGTYERIRSTYCTSRNVGTLRLQVSLCTHFAVTMITWDVRTVVVIWVVTPSRGRASKSRDTSNLIGATHFESALHLARMGRCVFRNIEQEMAS